MADEQAPLTFHPDAKRNFDEKANALAASLTSNAPVFDDSQGISVNPHVKAAFGKADILPDSSVWSQADHAGDETARYFDAGGQVFGLEGEKYLAFRRLAESIQRTDGMRDTISLDTIIDLLTQWLRSTRTGKAQETATDFVLSKSRSLVGEYTVLMPLYQLFIEEPFDLGNVLIRAVTEEEIDRWVSGQSKKNPEHAKSFEESGQRWKVKHQGQAAACMTLVAEPKRAYEVARREAEDALAMLHAFSVGMLVPGAKCYWTLLGSEKVEEYTYFILEADDLKTGLSGLYRFRNSVGSLSKALLAVLKSNGLDTASALLRATKRSDFQERLVEALLLYSRAAVQDGLAEKLLYIIVALESMLIRNDNEPIQQNLGERLAFTVGGSVEERKAIIKAVKRAYELRSRFMHHGRAIDDVKAMEAFMLYAYAFFEKVLRVVNIFQTRVAFLDALDNRKLA